MVRLLVTFSPFLIFPKKTFSGSVKITPLCETETGISIQVLTGLLNSILRVSFDVP